MQQAGRKDEAKTVLDGLLPKAAGDAALRLKLAEEYDRLGDPAAASRAMGQGPQDTLTYGLRAQYEQAHAMHLANHLSAFDGRG